MLKALLEPKSRCNKYCFSVYVVGWSSEYIEINKQKINLWMSPMATSNIKYPIWMIRISNPVIGVVTISLDEKIPISLNTICPALMLAASRNARVKGRTIILIVSISTKNGLSQSGAPAGNRWAKNIFGACTLADTTNESHIGKAMDKVKIKCLVTLNL